MNNMPADLPYAYGAPSMTGRIRTTPEDFFVDEELGFAPSGAGEHVLLQIQKRNINTEWLARELARLAGVRPMDVSYAGLKDRNAVTRQWFSVHLPRSAEPDWLALDNADVEIQHVARHNRKLRRGALTANRFELVLRELRGDLDGLESRLNEIRARGVPNYFGEQRYGHDNLAQAQAMVDGTLRVRDRFQRGMYLSTLRSELFNRVLAARVRAGCWDEALPGEALMLDGSHSYFVALEIDATLRERVAAHDVHPTGPLWGRGALATQSQVRKLEDDVLVDCAVWRGALEAAGLAQERRALRLMVKGLHWQRVGQDVFAVGFKLQAGSYATVVLRELLDCGKDGATAKNTPPAVPAGGA